MNTSQPIPEHAESSSIKVAQRRADLAVEGAPPAFDTALHVGGPNVGDRDLFMRHVGEMFDRRWFSNNGPLVQEFEQRLCKELGVRHCVAMCNGTIALEIAIRALGMEGEVIVPSYTFVATAHALHWQGITPVFADIDPHTHALDPDAVRRMITPRTSGIIGVHLWGRPAPANELQAVADEHGLHLMFDAAHAFACTYQGKKIGSLGRCEVFSFHATKFFNTFEGGAVTTNDDELAEAMRLMRNFGFAGYDNVVHPGTNGKMVEICAAMGLANLDAVHDIVNVNRRNHELYTSHLRGVAGVSILPMAEGEESNYQYVVLQVGEDATTTRDQLVEILQAENILARKYFWPGCHRMKPYRDLFPNAALMLPETTRIAERVIVLPTGTHVSEKAVASICSIIRVAVNGH
ncbi:aminotransferase class I/II-fold pyridoxal phosphate-dependent enzyme [Luteibacter aegosomaticola]|uniref:DegT/DnrJ/EryC1/StrS family aminotransferase n=1 Tax=Luteibacter aegosomaticola TaxID=2911538 RepID=UPI001FFBF2D2|nr:aminotransferase class I/II-fold pyridoxal phosphate-dependent enzyme [Luteibacter aegosomaticola]UPG91443.1 aminotransferase class I/II-fold pyridoxal phosphate-dependent enzyme [Luteibacter aegosomaticola]